MSKSKFPHFRYYHKSKHPALIVGERTSTAAGEEWKYRKVSHSAKDGRHHNEMVYPNPNPNDTKPMYIAKRQRFDKKKYFSNQPLPWKYTKKDK